MYIEYPLVTVQYAIYVTVEYLGTELMYDHCLEPWRNFVYTNNHNCSSLDRKQTENIIRYHRKNTIKKMKNCTPYFKCLNFVCDTYALIWYTVFHYSTIP